MIGEILVLLAELGFQQKELATALGLTPQTINDWYRGKKPLPPGHVPDLTALASLASATMAAGGQARDVIPRFAPTYRRSLSGSETVTGGFEVPDSFVDACRVALEAGNFDAHQRLLVAAAIARLALYVQQGPETWTAADVEAIRRAAKSVGLGATTVHDALAHTPQPKGDTQRRNK